MDIFFVYIIYKKLYNLYRIESDNMDRKKIIYIGSILLVTVFVSVTYFSYAFFTSKNEYHGRVNMVVGTLDYKLKSSLLSNNSITLASNEKARLHIEIESLNDINSKYELFYTTTNNNIEIGYNTTNDLPTGTINSKEKKTITVIIKNPSNSSATINFGVQGGFTHNTLTLETGKKSLTQMQSSYCDVDINTVYNYAYNGIDGVSGNVQEFVAPCDGVYKLETWGAQGGGVKPGYGGYSSGTVNLNKYNKAYVVVGGSGIESTTGNNGGGYNGGGHGTSINQPGSGGGGATHIATTNRGLLSNYQSYTSELLIVSGGGGGSTTMDNSNYGTGGSGGGVIGEDGGYYHNSNWSFYGTGGSQTSGGVCYLYGTSLSDSESFGSFGKGGNHGYENNNNVGGSGGGSGYYGGGGASRGHGQAGGGSGYIGNQLLSNKAMYCYNCTENLQDENEYTISTTGSSTLKDSTNCPNGYSSNPIRKCAMSGHGYAKITLIGENSNEEKSMMPYIITFNANGGTSIPNKVVQIGSSIGILPTPVKENNYFIGWYLDNNFTTKIDDTYVPTRNMVLYAKFGPEINLNLEERTQGYPSNEATDLNTKRSYTMNTYVIGLAFDNYYSPNQIVDYSFLNFNSLYLKTSSGYGIGLPMKLSNGNYILVGNISITAGNNALISVIKYTSDGTPTYNQKYYGNGSFIYDFSIDNSVSYEALTITANGTKTDLTVSNLHLYKID